MNTDQPVNNHDDMRKVTDNILRDAGMAIEDSGGKVTFAGKEPVRKTVIKAGATTACILAANAVAEAAIWKERTGESQDIHVDLRKAWIEQSPWQKDALNYTKINGVSKAWNSNVFVLLPQIGRARDGRWLVMAPCYPSQQRKAMNLLRCGPDHEQVRAAMARRESAELEEATEAVQVPLQMIRTKEEWTATEQGRIHAETPLIQHREDWRQRPHPAAAERAPPLRPEVPVVCPRRRQPLRGPNAGHARRRVHEPEHARLGGVRKFLLHRPGRPAAGLSRRTGGREPQAHLQTGRECRLLCRKPAPGCCDQEGYSPQALAERKPGIIYVSVKLNTNEGPWTNWPGYDVNAGGICGLYTAEGTPDQPLLPQQVNVVCDIMTGYLGAIGAKAALLRRAREGGSYVVRITLSQCVQYMISLGFNDKREIENLENLGEKHQIMKPELVTGMTAFGEYTRPASQVEMSKTPQFWDDPMLYMQGASQPVWTTDAEDNPV